MTILEAKKTGKTKMIKLTAIVVGVIFLLLFFQSVQGDFANGILFFFEAINIHMITILLIIFFLTYFLGAKAGKEIIIDKKNIFLVSLKHVLTIILSIIIYAGLIGVFKDKYLSASTFTDILINYFLTPLFKTGSMILIPLLLIWLWVTYQMKPKTIEQNKK